MNMFTKLFAVSAIACMATAVQAQEVTTPPTFDIDPGEVGVIFAADQDTYFEVIKDSKGNSASNWAPVKWGQTCTVSEDEAGDGAAIIYHVNIIKRIGKSSHFLILRNMIWTNRVAESQTIQIGRAHV